MLNYLNKILLLIACLLSHVAGAQENIRFEATTNVKQVLLNGYFDVVFTLRNANGTDFTAPSFNDFTILAGPNTASSIQIVNGVVSREESFSYILQPKKVGKFTIGSANILANGKKMSTTPLTVEVVKGSEGGPSQAANEDVFIRLEVSKNNAYIGEQVHLDFKLYTTVSIDGYDIREEPDYRGFFAHELRRFNSSPVREVIGGKQYTTKILRRISLFPQQAGALRIDPAHLKLDVVEESEQRGFAFSRRVRPVFLKTNPVEINVKKLPAGAPDGFGGAAGSFTFQAATTRSRVSTDEAITINVLITGNGDMKRVQPPNLPLSDSFEVYAPKVIEEQTSETQGELMGKKVVEYLVLPKYPGAFTLAPTFTFFDTEGAKYVTLESAPINIMVAQGTDRHTGARPSPTATAPLADIRFIKTRTKLERKGQAFFASPLFWGITTLPFTAFLGVFFFRKIKERQEQVDPESLKKRLAAKEAQKRLAAAHGFYRSGDSRAFYDEVSKASLGYVCDKLNIPLSQLTKDNVQEKLQSLGVSTPIVDDFMGLVKICEMALFAGMDNHGDMKETYDKAMSIITEIETEIEKR